MKYNFCSCNRRNAWTAGNTPRKEWKEMGLALCGGVKGQYGVAMMQGSLLSGDDTQINLTDDTVRIDNELSVVAG